MPKHVYDVYQKDINNKNWEYLASFYNPEHAGFFIKNVMGFSSIHGQFEYKVIHKNKEYDRYSLAQVVNCPCCGDLKIRSSINTKPLKKQALIQFTTIDEIFKNKK